MKESVGIISHSKDPDGLIAHAIILHHLKKVNLHREFNIISILLDYSEMYSFFQSNEISFDKLYITDLPLTESAISDWKLITLCEKTRLFYYDHHYISPQREHLLQHLCKQYNRVNNVCSSKIVSESLEITNEYFLRLAEIAQAHDFNTDGPNLVQGKRLMNIISGLNQSELLQFVEDLCNQSWIENLETFEFNPKYKQKEQKALLKIKEAYKILESTIERVRIDDKTIIVAFSPRLLYMKLGMRYLEKRSLNADAILLLTENEHNVLFSSTHGKTSVEIPVLPYCIFRKGGGRNNAGGFYITQIITKDNYRKIAHEIVEDFSVYMKANY